MSYAVVIPTNRVFSHIEPLLTSLVRQIFLPSQIIIVYDQYMIGEELDEYEKSINDMFVLLGDKKPDITIIHSLYDVDFKIGR
jgi:hypothetical protein